MRCTYPGPSARSNSERGAGRQVQPAKHATNLSVAGAQRAKNHWLELKLQHSHYSTPRPACAPYISLLKTQKSVQAVVVFSVAVAGQNSTAAGDS